MDGQTCSKINCAWGGKVRPAGGKSANDFSDHSTLLSLSLPLSRWPIIPTFGRQTKNPRMQPAADNATVPIRGKMYRLLNSDERRELGVRAWSIAKNLGIFSIVKNRFFFTIPVQEMVKRIISRFPGVGIKPALLRVVAAMLEGAIEVGSALKGCRHLRASTGPSSSLSTLHCPVAVIREEKR